MKTKDANRISRMLLAVASIGIFGSVAAGAQAPAAAPAAPAAQSAAAQSALKGNLESGKKLYVTYACYACHGSQGRAGGAAPVLVAPAMSVEALIKYIRKPAGNMPAYTTKSGVTDQEIADIQAYLASISKDVDPKSIPLLQNLNTP